MAIFNSFLYIYQRVTRVIFMVVHCASQADPLQSRGMGPAGFSGTQGPIASDAVSSPRLSVSVPWEYNFLVLNAGNFGNDPCHHVIASNNHPSNPHSHPFPTFSTSKISIYIYKHGTWVMAAMGIETSWGNKMNMGWSRPSFFLNGGTVETPPATCAELGWFLPPQKINVSSIVLHLYILILRLLHTYIIMYTHLLHAYIIHTLCLSLCIYMYTMYIYTYVCMYLCGGILNRGTPYQSKSLDHDLVLKPMVWGTPAF